MARKPTKNTEEKDEVLVERPSKNPRGIEYDREISNVSASDAAKIVAELTPFVGDVMAAKEIFEETQKEDPNWFMIGALGGAAVVGLIPGIGDAASALIKRGAKASSRKTAPLMDEASKAISRSDLDDSIGRSGRKMYDEEDVLEADDLIFSWEKGEISNPELRKRMKEIGFPVDTKRIMPKKTGEELEVVNPNNNKIQQWKDVPMGFAEGGDVSRQMDAVFKSTRVDPVSGNEVPPGSLPEEVRDDVPAMLSEGEYVVPADVLRYYGVKFFEDLRDKAKAEMSGMEAEGRTGQPMDDDMPFSLEELNVVDVEDDMPEMSKGGYVKGYAEGGVVYDPNVANMQVPDFLKNVNPFGGSNEEYKTFKNDAGMTMTVRYVNGKPTSYIPPGYKEESAASATITGAAPTTTSQLSKEEEERQRRIREGDFGEATPTGMATQSTATIAGQLQGVQTGKGLAGFVSKALDNSVLGLVSKALTGKSLSQNNIESMQAELASRFDTDEGKQDFKDMISDMEKSGKIDAAHPSFDMAVTGGVGRDFFSSDESFADAMNATAGKGMSFDPGIQSSVTDPDTGKTSNVTGGLSRSGSAAPTSSVTPVGRKGTDMNPGTKGGRGTGEGPSGGPTVICTALHNKGLLDSKVFELDAEYGKLVRTNNPELMDGYLKLATPFANYIQKDTIGAVAARYAVAPFARAWAYEMAHQMKPEEYKGNILGKAIMAVGYPICALVGKKEQEQAHAV